MRDLVLKNFRDHMCLVLQMAVESYADKISLVSDVIINAYRNNNKVLIAGNGGSAADAQHITAELVNKFYHDRRPLSAISLTTDTSLITSWANDKNYDFVFERQIEAHGNKGDIFIAISTSGNSQNLINAISKAREKGLIIISLLGKDGGKIKGLSDYEIIVPSQDTPRIQEIHQIIYHTVCQLVEQSLLK